MWRGKKKWIMYISETILKEFALDPFKYCMLFFCESSHALGTFVH
jgi:hypothetical protein